MTYITKVAIVCSVGFFIVAKIVLSWLSSWEHFVHPSGWLFRWMNLAAFTSFCWIFSFTVLGTVSVMQPFLGIGLLSLSPYTWTLPSFPFSGFLYKLSSSGVLVLICDGPNEIRLNFVMEQSFAACCWSECERVNMSCPSAGRRCRHSVLWSQFGELAAWMLCDGTICDILYWKLEKHKKQNGKLSSKLMSPHISSARSWS